MKSSSMVLIVSIILGLSLRTTSPAADLPGISPEVVTDYLHAIIEADRTFYTIHVVERLQHEGGTVAAENWRAKRNVLPLPAQFLMEASDLASKTGTKVRYRLISLWPINPHNGPVNDRERLALESLRADPEHSVTSTSKVGDRRYFQAIYADRAISQACIACHNSHPRSPKKDFQANDVMGGLVIEIPVEP